jgi:heme/copper-type cytochrome/quinol oxidase subunit 2
MTGHQNFSKQKFTNLKSIKKVKSPSIQEEQLAENAVEEEGQVLNSSNSSNSGSNPKLIVGKNNNDCDRVILDNGSVMEVSVKRVSFNKLWYTKCGESSSSEWLSLSRVVINRIDYANNPKIETTKIVDEGTSTEKIIRAIEKQHTFIVTLDKEEFLMKNPRYDGIYGTVSGELAPVQDISDTATVKIEITANRFEKGSNNKIEIWTKSIQSISVNHITREVVKNEAPKPTTTVQNSTSTSNTIVVNETVPVNMKTTSEDDWNENSIVHNKKELIKRNKDKSRSAFGAVALFFLLMVVSLAVMIGAFVAGLILLLIALLGIYASLVAVAVFARRYNKGRKELGSKRDVKNGVLTGFTWFFITLISIPLLGIPLVLALIIAQTEGAKSY